MKKKQLIFALTVLCALCLCAATALADVCSFCEGSGYVAVKSAATGEYVAVPCPQCSNDQTDTTDSQDEEPQPATEEADLALTLFPGYTEVASGETIRVKGVGNFTFTKLHLGDPIYAYDSYHSKSLMLVVWAEGQFDNTSTSKLYYKNLFHNTQLHYINEDNDYVYDAWTIGEYRDGEYFSSKLDTPISIVGNIKSLTESDYTYASIDPLNERGFVIGFQGLPDRITSDEDGIIAITFQLEGSSEKYVFFGRK